MQGAEVVHPAGQEVADLEAVLVVHEHGGRLLVSGYEDLRHDAEALAYIDGGGDGGITDCGPIGGVGPFGDGDHITRLATLEILGVDVGVVLQGWIEDLHGGQLQGPGDQQVLGVDGHLGTGAVIAGGLLDEHGLVVHGGADYFPFGSSQGGGQEVLMASGGGDGGGIEEGSGICHGGADVGIGGEDGSDQGGDLSQSGAGQFPGVGFELAGFVPVDELESQRDITAVLDEGCRFRAVPDGQLGVLGAFCDGGQGADGSDQGSGDVVEGIEVLLRDRSWSTSHSRPGPGNPRY